MSGGYDDFCAENRKAINHPLDKTLTLDSLKGLVLAKPQTSATGENNRSYAQGTKYKAMLTYGTGPGNPLLFA